MPFPGRPQAPVLDTPAVRKLYSTGGLGLGVAVAIRDTEGSTVPGMGPEATMISLA